MSRTALLAPPAGTPSEAPESTGLPRGNLGTHEVARAPERPLSLAWVTDDLVAYTREVWARRLGRPVPEEEAVEMLVNVKRLAEAMMKAAEPEGDAPR